MLIEILSDKIFCEANNSDCKYPASVITDGEDVDIHVKYTRARDFLIQTIGRELLLDESYYVLIIDKLASQYESINDNTCDNMICAMKFTLELFKDNFIKAIHGRIDINTYNEIVYYTRDSKDSFI